MAERKLSFRVRRDEQGYAVNGCLPRRFVPEVVLRNSQDSPPVRLQLRSHSMVSDTSCPYFVCPERIPKVC